MEEKEEGGEETEKKGRGRGRPAKKKQRKAEDGVDKPPGKRRGRPRKEEGGDKGERRESSEGSSHLLIPSYLRSRFGDRGCVCQFPEEGGVRKGETERRGTKRTVLGRAGVMTERWEGEGQCK